MVTAAIPHGWVVDATDMRILRTWVGFPPDIMEHFVALWLFSDALRDAPKGPPSLDGLAALVRAPEHEARGRVRGAEGLHEGCHLQDAGAELGGA